ncbi:hypothetical protein HON59_00945 [bacterium]|jgi:hypothetical protein|nr:hypothetical protein [bacterium]MBT3730171.1 hypothetical protein [bacterium]MBT4894619.1 hypothetical protein [bacterium]
MDIIYLYLKIWFIFSLVTISVSELIQVKREYVNIDRYLKSYVDKEVVDKCSHIKYIVDDYCFNLVGEKILKITYDNVLYTYVHPGEVSVVQKNNLLESPK